MQRALMRRIVAHLPPLWQAHSERRQRIFSGCVAVASLAVGWILNAISLPAIVVGIFNH